MNTRSTTSRSALRRLMSAASGIWADCDHASRRQVQSQMGPVGGRRYQDERVLAHSAGQIGIDPFRG